MGTSHSVELIPEQDSPSAPGCKSVLTGSFDDLDPPVSAEAFLNELIEYLRWPVDPTTEAVLKSCTVVENGTDDFTVKILVDGVKLDSYGYGKGDGTDRVRSWKRVKVDRAAMKVTTEDYVPEPALGAWADEASDKEVIATAHIQLLKDPTRGEFWVVDKEGNRHSGDGLAQGLYFWTDRVIGQLHAEAKAKVKAAQGKGMKHPGEDSIVTEPLDEHVDYDSFFDKMVTVIKEKLEKAPNAEIEAGESEIVCRMTETDAEGQQKVSTHTLKFSADAGELTIAHTDNEGKVVNTSFRQVHKSPLVVEAWNITRSGERSAGVAFSKLVQKEVNEIIDRANSWFG